MVDSANDEFFRAATAPQAMKDAVAELVDGLDRNMEEMELYTMGQIFAMAVDHYDDDLPQFWRVWQDWHDSDDVQPMGDL